MATGYSTKTGSGRTAHERFQGSYKLITYITQVEGDSPQNAAWQNGRIIYSGNRMCACFMTTEYGQEKDQPVAGYSGAFSIDEEKGTVTHEVDIVACAPTISAVYPGSSQLRVFEFSDDDKVLRLIAEMDGPGGKKTTHTLTWHRE